MKRLLVWNWAARFRRLICVPYFISNFIGLSPYFKFSTNISDLARMEQRDYYDGVDGVTYSCTAVPVLLVFFVINLLWGIKALVDILRRKEYQALMELILIAACWAADFGLCSYLARTAIKTAQPIGTPGFS